MFRLLATVLLGVPLAAQWRPGFLTEINGSGNDTVTSIVRAPDGGFLAAGVTDSLDLPATGFQKRPGGSTLYRLTERPEPLFPLDSTAVAALHAARDGRLFAASQRRLGVSSDLGQTWQRLGGGLPLTEQVTGIATDAGDARLLVVSTRLGVYRSEDGGATFQPAGLRDPEGFFSGVFADPHQPGRFLATKWGTHYRSEDGGRTWTQGMENLRGIVFDAGRPGLAYALAVVFRQSTVAKSTDGGRTWTLLPSIPEEFNLTSVAIDGGRPGRLLVSSFSGIFRSLDDGVTWVRTSVGTFMSALEFDPVTGRTLAVSSDEILASRDGFDTVTKLDTGLFGATLVRSVRGVPVYNSVPSRDGWVARLSESGRVEWLTYLGGRLNDEALAVAVGPGGEAYVVGATFSFDFPFSAGTPRIGSKAFVARVSADGQRLTWAFTPGEPFSAATVVQAAADGTVLVAAHSTIACNIFGGCGTALGPPSPVKLPLTIVATPSAFRISAQGTSVLWRSEADRGWGAAVGIFDTGDRVALVAPQGVLMLDPAGARLGSTTFSALAKAAAFGNGKLHLAGDTFSVFAATPGAFQTTSRDVRTANGDRGPFRGTGDAFWMKYDLASLTLEAASFYSGDGRDEGRAVALDREGNVLLGGSTYSLGLPTRGAFQGPYASLTGFLARFSGDGTRLLDATYVGDTRNFLVTALAADRAGRPVFAGNTAQPPFFDSAQDESSVFIVRYDPLETPLRIDAVTNAASRLAAPLAPDVRLVITGSGFPADPAVFASDVPLRVVSATAERIEVLAPADADRNVEYRIRVDAGGRSSNEVFMPVARFAPAIFTRDGSGTGAALLLDEGGRPVEAVRPGQVVRIVANGLGRLRFAGASAIAEGELQVFIGGVWADGLDAQVLPAPGLTGETYQLVVRVPPGLPEGPAAVNLRIGEFWTQAGVTVAVKP